MFPVHVTKLSMRASSSSGGKDYHLVLISANDGKSILIKRWGKKNQWGTGWDLKCYTTRREAAAEFDAKEREKKRRYTETLVSTSIPYDSLESLKVALRLYWSKMGAENIEWLLPGTDTTGVKDASKSGHYNEYGDWVEPETPQRIAAPPVEENVEDLVRENPNYGIWG